MEQLEQHLRQPQAQATLCYALGKAHEDCGDVDEAFRLYAKGAAIRRQLSPFDMDRFRRCAEDAIAGYPVEPPTRRRRWPLIAVLVAGIAGGAATWLALDQWTDQSAGDEADGTPSMSSH